jgi:hypothetical protein
MLRAPKHVGVDVDQPRCYVETRGVDDLARPACRQVRTNGSDFASADGHVTYGIDVVFRIDDVPAFDDQIVVLGKRHRRKNK